MAVTDFAMLIFRDGAAQGDFADNTVSKSSITVGYTGENYVMCLRFSFDEPAEGFTLRLRHSAGTDLSYSSSRKFRYKICAERSAQCENPDANTEYDGETAAWAYTADTEFTQSFDTGLLRSGETYYLYFWAVNFSSEANYQHLRWNTRSAITSVTPYSGGAAYISDGTEYVPHTAHIYSGVAWAQYVPYIYSGTQWEIC